MAERGWPAFPVVFFDGEREMDIGDVWINPTLEFKPFQLMLSQKIGISPNKISIYLDGKKSRKAPFSEDSRRIPITGKVNFSLISRQKDRYFLVVLKRSRKSRIRRERMIHGLDFSGFLPENEFPIPAMHTLPESLVLLRRNHQVPFHDQITQSGKNGLKSLTVQRENYRMVNGRPNLNLLDFYSGYGFDPNQISIMGMDIAPDIDDSYLMPSATTMLTSEDNERKAFCEECLNAEKNGSTASFHPCVNDAVIACFTTRFGPVRIPNKKQLP